MRFKRHFCFGSKLLPKYATISKKYLNIINQYARWHTMTQPTSCLTTPLVTCPASKWESQSTRGQIMMTPCSPFPSTSGDPCLLAMDSPSVLFLVFVEDGLYIPFAWRITTLSLYHYHTDTLPNHYLN